jgi:eukaryotic-like serine/threonine-protein kinase
VGDYAVTVLDQKGQKRILSRGWKAENNLNWSPNADEIWFGGAKAGEDTALRAVSLSGKERTVAEAPAWMAMDDITRDGNVLVTVVDSRTGISALAPGATQERDLSWFDASLISDISADGRTILFVEVSYGKDRNTAIYVRKTDGSPAVRLGDGNRPVLSPDGKWVACIASDGPKTDLTLLPTGPGEARSIGAAGMHYERLEWFPDGQRLLFTGNEPGRPLRAFIQNLSGGRPVPITPEGIPASQISPDGKYVTTRVGGKLDLFPVAGGEAKTVAGFEAGDSVIRWSRDGRSLFVQRSQEPSAVKIQRLDIANGRKEAWRELKTPDPVGVQIGQIAMTPDGSAYAYSFQRDISTLYLAKGLR